METVITRGCGVRAEDGLYACVGLSEFGMPVEWFLVDPVKPWVGGHFRAPLIFYDESMGIHHVAMWVGATEGYPFVPDLVEEARRYGVSKRIPRGFEVGRLTPGMSGLLLIHPRAIPRFDYVCDWECPKKEWKPELHGDGSPCVGNLWPLSSVKGMKGHELREYEANEKIVTVRTPSCSYTVNVAYEADGETRMKRLGRYGAGAFMFFPKFHFEYVSSSGGAPKEVEEPISSRGWEFKVTER